MSSYTFQYGMIVHYLFISVIYNAFFHPLASIPGNKLLTSSYFLTSLAFLTGRSPYALAFLHNYYGKVIRIAPNFVSVADKDMIREILVTSDFPKGIIHEGLTLTGQNTMFSSTDKYFHKNRRRLIAPAFGLQYLQSLEPIIHDCIHEFLCKVDEVLEDPGADKNKKPLPEGHIDICSLMLRLSLDIIGETALGQSFHMIRDNSHLLPALIAKGMKRSTQQSFNPWMKWILPFDLSFIELAVERVRERKSKGEKGRRADLLQYLIDAQAREHENGDGEMGDDHVDMVAGKLTDSAIAGEAIVFLVGGSETSSTTMTYALMFLVEDHGKLIKLREELDLATANNAPGAIPSYDQIRNLPYLTGCVNEALRLRAAAAVGIPRVVPEDVTLNGHFFPKGTAGTRNCVGKNFAMKEMRLILATVILNYDLLLVPGQRQDYVHYITISLATGTYVIKMKKRHSDRRV
ncbi:hypothetical protein BGZ67_008852 [Mortierella alpina]|nr:hypothetical protein BGZ67_008852 [Mortierella alpina]